MKTKMDNKGQGNMLLMLMIFMILIIFVMPVIAEPLGEIFGSVLEPAIGFNGNYPVVTLFCAGLIVVTLSSVLTSFFSDWVQMGKSQHVSKHFQKEMTKARKAQDQKRIKKLMKMQPEIMKKQTESSSGMMKPMLFLIIFIWPIFMWLRSFLAGVPHYYVTLPWDTQVPLISSETLLMQAWLWMYLIFSVVIGQVIRQGLKYFTLSEWWRETKKKIIPSFR